MTHQPDEEPTAHGPTTHREDTPLEDVVVPFERVKLEDAPPPPAIRLPPMTWIMLCVIIGIQAVLSLLPQNLHMATLYVLGYIPLELTSLEAFVWYAPLTLLTHGLVHGGWMHLAINSLMLLAFGAGVERHYGALRFLCLLGGGVIAGAAAQTLLGPFATMPMVGLSGGLSALFAVALRDMVGSITTPQSRKKLLKIIAVVVAIILIGGVIGGPSGEKVAWAGHLGGFVAGLVAFRWLRR